jgi:hypothetical protein
MHFESGKSQLFRVANSGHNLFWDNPRKLAEYIMIGFFEEITLATFEEKPRDEFVPREKH